MMHQLLTALAEFLDYADRQLSILACRLPHQYGYDTIGVSTTRWQHRRTWMECLFEPPLNRWVSCWLSAGSRKDIPLGVLARVESAAVDHRTRLAKIDVDEEFLTSDSGFVYCICSRSPPIIVMSQAADFVWYSAVLCQAECDASGDARHMHLLIPSRRVN